MLGHLKSALEIGKTVAKVFDEAHFSKEEQARVIADQIQQRDNIYLRELHSKTRIIESDNKDGDWYVKRSRPSIVYTGLIMSFINYTLAPILGFEQIPLPEDWLYVWSGIVGTYAVGRSYEKIKKVSN